MRVYNKKDKSLIVDIDIKTFLFQGGEEAYSVLYKEENVEEVYEIRELVYEFEDYEISEYATNHIYKYYPIWKQVNIDRSGSDEEKNKMVDFINRVKEWTNSENPQLLDDSLTNILP
jgi:hypothetical protein